MKIERVSISSLTYDPHNASKHSRKNLQAIMSSLEEFGQQKTMLVERENKNVLCE